jgi:hypothetical protein
MPGPTATSPSDRSVGGWERLLRELQDRLARLEAETWANGL